MCLAFDFCFKKHNSLHSNFVDLFEILPQTTHLLNFMKFTKNYTKTFTFYTSIIPLLGKTKHLKTPGIQFFVNEQGTLGPGALYKLRYIFKICYYNYIILFF